MELVPLATLPDTVPGSHQARVHPAEPVRYPAMLRGSRNRWWRPFVAFFVFVISFLILVSIIGMFVGFAMVAQGVTTTDPELMMEILLDTSNPMSLFMLLFSIVIMIPCAFLAQFVAFGQRPGSIMSVKRRMRWDLLGTMLLVVLPLWGAYLLATSVLTDQFRLDPQSNILVLLVISLIFAPLQSAAEEIVFRGAMVQSIGSWIASPVVAMVVGGIVSTAIFVPLHGAADPWIILDLVIFAVAAVVLTWKTGGLEAAIVYHAVNNTVLFVLNALSGGYMNSLAAAEGAGSTPLNTVITGVATALLVMAMLKAFKSYERKKEREKTVVSTPQYLSEPQMMQAIVREVPAAPTQVEQPYAAQTPPVAPAASPTPAPAPAPTQNPYPPSSSGTMPQPPRE